VLFATAGGITENETEVRQLGIKIFLFLHAVHQCCLAHLGECYHCIHAFTHLSHALQVVWKFDKRTYGDQPPPRNLDEPPPVVDNDLARLIVAMINEVSLKC
jgi:hypothetical protein